MSTSTLTSRDISARVRARTAALLPPQFVERADHNIALTIEGGLERLARAVKDSADRALLTRTIANKIPEVGKIDLSHADYAGMLIDTFRRPGAINTHAVSSAVFYHVPSLDALKATNYSDADTIWYLLYGKQLIFKNPVDKALNTYGTALALSGVYIPVLGDAARPLPGELDDQAIDRVTEIVQKMGGLGFLQADPELAMQMVKKA